MTTSTLLTLPAAQHAGTPLKELLPEHGWVLSFSGQGFEWTGTLNQMLGAGAQGYIEDILATATAALAPVAGELLTARPQGFDLLKWAHAAHAGTAEHAAAVPDTADAAVSVPGIVLAQLAVLDRLRAQGLDIDSAHAAIGHSQGVLAAAVASGTASAAEILALAQLIGAAAATHAPALGLAGGATGAMLHLQGISPGQLKDAIAALPPTDVPVVTGLVNGPAAAVAVGRPRDLELLRSNLEETAERSRAERKAKRRGGAPFDPAFSHLPIPVGFHHPALQPAVEEVVARAQRCGLDPRLARDMAQAVLTEPVDWPAVLEQTLGAATAAPQAGWVLECGPGAGISAATAQAVAGRGVGVLVVSDLEGHSALCDRGAAPTLPRPWSDWAPRLVRDKKGRTRVATAFTELTGRSPMLLPGMTPTTVDPAIVAAAANGGHWAELAGGGQVTPAIAHRNLTRLATLLKPGVNAQFNAMFLDPSLWGMHIAGKKLVLKARANGAPIDGIVISAGLPEHHAAVDLVRQLRAAEFNWVCFKPGTIAHITKALAIARDVPEVPIIIQVEGGHAGGHHSWEDLDQLLLDTYAKIRATDNVVLCVGGGIATPEQATAYITGRWATAYGRAPMPVDGVLLGTVAMACKEATTSEAVKDLLVATPGTTDWVGAGTAAEGMASGRSQLGADIHEIDNAAARAGRLLDQVAGDEQAVQQRREEIISALAQTAKPYFGDAADMTYQRWLERYVELSGPAPSGAETPAAGDPHALTGEDSGGWRDITWYARFEKMIARAEARLSPVDHGQFTAQVHPTVDTDPAATIAQLISAYPHAATQRLHPADVQWFISLSASRGKPVNFVPVIDKEIRRRWRSDSLWQSHDPRYSADQVSIIPGIRAVAGITRKNEPVAQLLDRFCQHTAGALAAAGVAEETQTPTVVEEILAAPGTSWAGREGGSLIARLGQPEGWELTADRSAATHRPTGATLVAEAGAASPEASHVVLTVPLHGSTAPGTTADLSIRFTLPAGAPAGAVPQVTAGDAEEAMAALTTLAAGGELAPLRTDADGTRRAEWTTTFTAAHSAQYQRVTSAALPRGVHAHGPAPDVLVGLAWPAIFSAVRHAHLPATQPADSGSGAPDTRHSRSVVEGMLSLVHLEHHLTMGERSTENPAEQQLPAPGTALKVTAHTDQVEDTDMGRLIVVRATITNAATGQPVATLAERFVIRGRAGEATARTNTSILPTVVDTPRSFRARATVTAPQDLRPFGTVSGDRNPIHVCPTAAHLAGLPGVIVHGMWTSAMGELIAQGAYHGAADEDSPNTTVTRAGKIVEYTATMLAPVLPGQKVTFTVERSGMDSRPGRGEVRAVTATVDGTPVLTATAVMAAPTTFYAFPGQGIQSQGMGMKARGTSAAARAVWDRADRHTRTKLGFSVLEIVQNNPTEVTVKGERFFHPKGVLYLTQFTQVAMATLAVAQVAQLRSEGALSDRAFFAGHSVGEYNALAAYAGVLSVESVVEIVYARGLTMHRLVPRDAEGRSNYGLAALRPNKMGLSADQVQGFVEQIAAQTGEFLQIVNYNLDGLQYAVAGTVRGLKALGARAEEMAPGQRALIMIPGIDVPFHSLVLRDGVPDFRAHLDELLPEVIDTDVLVGRYIPNLVARPFELTEDFARSIAQVVDSQAITAILADFDAAARDRNALTRTLLVELLAWQFASPVRWIETQDLALTRLGVERFVEVGVGSAPTIANMMGQTLTLPKYAGADVEVLNVERDAPVVFATDAVEAPAVDAVEAPVASDATVSATVSAAATAAPETAATPADSASATDSAAPAAAQSAAPAAAAPAPAAGGERPADQPVTPEDATEFLVALWTKVRPDQMTEADSIETLVEGVSSRRNQLLLDLGVEFGLGAIDGAADAELPDLYATVTRMAKGYTAFGPVLADAVADALRRITGPTGKKPGYIAERVTGYWQLGQGWADRATIALVLGARDGASLRGGDLATLAPATPSSAAELDQLIDAAVAQAGAARGVSIAPPAAGGAAGGVVDSAALGEFAEMVTGKAGVLAATARTILQQLGLNHAPQTEGLEAEEADAKLFELVSQELGSDWPRQVSHVFDARRAVLLDDRWASAREDLARAATAYLAGTDGAQQTLDSLDVTGAGEQVALQAEYWATLGVPGMERLAQQARTEQADAEASLRFASDVAVVTGASPNSIAASVVGELLAGGATVVATTSSLNHQRLTFYKDLYRTHARGAAALWVVPANLSSFADLDAVIEWIGNEQTATVNGATTVLKPALKPTLLVPFAAPRVSGSLADAGPRAENEMRLLLWSVERLIAGLSEIGANTHVGERLHVLLPGSPNRGRFGGDGAYGESKAALDALVTRWNAEPVWAERTSLVHALIGWVRGTGLMGGNDPLVDAVEAAGVTTYSTDEMAAKLAEQLTAKVRDAAITGPVTVDFTGGLGEADLDLAQLARDAQAAEEEQSGEYGGIDKDAPVTLKALPTPYRALSPTRPHWNAPVTQSLGDMVVIVGAGELGPYGSSRTRFDAELTGDLTAAGVTELAWSMGLIAWEDDSTPGWYTPEGERVAEEDIFDRFHDTVLARVGVRRYHDDFGMVDNLAPELTTVYLDNDLTFAVQNKDEAKAFKDSNPDGTTIAQDPETGEWLVTRAAGSEIRVPRRMAMSRFVGGQVPEGFDPTRYGIPADMADNLDRVALWNLVCTVDAFLASGFSPKELLGALHPTRVSSTQGTGMGGMESMRSLYIDRILAEPRANDILQEALPNVVAAHVMQSYVGGYGQMIHPVAACATAAVSVEEGMDKIRLGKADFVVAGGIDDLSVEGITGFGDMAATADSGVMAAKGIEERYFSRANDRRRGGFVESAGGGTILMARGTLAYELGLPVLGVVAFAESFADGAHTSIPAPGLGALGAAMGGTESRLAQGLKALGVSADEVSVISKHDTSTTANDPNESDLHERIAAALGRADGNPLYVISQKTLTGHAKGGAAAFQLVGLTQILRSGQIPANRALDCVDPVLAKHQHLVWLRESLDLSAPETAPKAGLVTSLGFGHVSALIAMVHPEAFRLAVEQEHGQEAAAAWQRRAHQREVSGLARIAAAMHGGAALFERPVERNLGVTGAAAKQVEAAILLDPGARLVDGVLTPAD